MKKNDFVSNDGDELKDHQESCWQNAVEMQFYPNFVGGLQIVIAFPCDRTERTGQRAFKTNRRLMR